MAVSEVLAALGETPAAVSEGRVSHLNDKVSRLKEQMQRFKQIGEQLQAAPDKQVSLTDPDARSMATSGRGTGMVGYNVQTAVDTQHHLIVAHEVTNVGHDRQQLSIMAQQAGQATGNGALTVLADRGYFNGEQIRDCEQHGIIPLVPKPLTSNNKAAGLFDKRDFTYVAERNEYRCPAGQIAIYRHATVERGMTLHRYWDRASCTGCSLKAQCTPSIERPPTRTSPALGCSKPAIRRRSRER